jgi:hypothetical protein
MNHQISIQRNFQNFFSGYLFSSGHKVALASLLQNDRSGCLVPADDVISSNNATAFASTISNSSGCESSCFLNFRLKIPHLPWLVAVSEGRNKITTKQLIADTKKKSASFFAAPSKHMNSVEKSHQKEILLKKSCKYLWYRKSPSSLNLSSSIFVCCVIWFGWVGPVAVVKIPVLHWFAAVKSWFVVLAPLIVGTYYSAFTRFFAHHFSPRRFVW